MAKAHNSGLPAAMAGADDPLWYKDAILYELHVRAFYDSNGDGIGDFRGLTEKLDYLQDLGITAVWLLPFYPSPLRDDGYDTANYTDVLPAYGKLSDFRTFLREAHGRGLRVITELVLNHTSDQHPWFQRARRSPPGSAARNFYVWSDTPEKYREARIIFKDFEPSNWSWDPVANAYYWHRFYAHQPDLNYENPEVHKTMFRLLDFWLEMGVDGMRLDAVPYLYEREGTNCENLPETYEFLKKLRRHIDENFANRMLLAEANQWPEDSVAYFGNGDACHTAFHFPVMPRMWMALQMEDRYPIIDILDQTPAIPENCQWTLFLRNHDELTLEMVTDEERDYMYRMYAHDPQARINLGIRRRLAPLLGNDRRKIELMNGLLFSLPGTPIVYYGDEIGMGDNVYLGDRNGVRTPMQWSNDRNAGFSRANPQRLYLPTIIDPDHHYEVVNVETQRRNANSLFWWTKRLISLRKQFKAFGRGTMDFLYPDNSKVLAFVRCYQNENILVVANLSRLAQYVELDLSKYAGMTPVELFGRTEFPAVADRPYLLTLGPFAFYWLALERRRVMTVVEKSGHLPVPPAEARVPAPEAEAPLARIEVADPHSLFTSRGRNALARVLPDYLARSRWFGGKARKMKSVEVVDSVALGAGRSTFYLAFVQVDYTEAEPQLYLLPLGICTGERAQDCIREHPNEVVAEIGGKGHREGVLYEAVREKEFADALLAVIARRKRLRGTHGELVGSPGREFRALRGDESARLDTSVLRAEQSNTSILYGNVLLLKLFRQLEAGTNPEVELGAHLTRAGYSHAPQLAATLEYERGSEPITVGVMHGFVPSQGDAWNFTLDHIDRYFEHVMTMDGAQAPAGIGGLVELAFGDIPPLAHETIGTYLEAARLLGQRTGELHAVLASETADAAFAPEPFGTLYQRSLYQSMRNQTSRSLQLLRRQLRNVPEDTRDDARAVLDSEGRILQRFHRLLERKLMAMRTRIHGDFHLGQVLWTGRDFVLIDFEGEPARALSERRIKRSPLRDVAGMLRSFHYATYAGLYRRFAAMARNGQMSGLERWARAWYVWVSSAFLRSYLKAIEGHNLVPADRADLQLMLDVYRLEKALYELSYELNHRPDWLKLPLRGILQLLEQ